MRRDSLITISISTFDCNYITQTELLIQYSTQLQVTKPERITYTSIKKILSQQCVDFRTDLLVLAGWESSRTPCVRLG